MRVATLAFVVLDRQQLSAAWLSVAMVVAAGIVSAVHELTPFARGSWLVAYLVLVGGVAQALLAFGPRWAGATIAPSAHRWAGTGLWVAGSLLVPAGRLAALAPLTIAGSIALLAALAGYAATVLRAPRGGSQRVWAYLALVVFLAASVGVGLVLAFAGS